MEQTWDVEILQKVRENTQIEISRLFLDRFWKFKFLLVPYEMAHVVVIWFIKMVDEQILFHFYQFYLHSAQLHSVEISQIFPQNFKFSVKLFFNFYLYDF